jgi:protein O-mannosyl-transferase
MSPLVFGLLAMAFLGAGLLVYGPALHGEFVSDDQHYVRDNPYIKELSAEHLRVIWNPFSVLPLVVENYAPVHVMLHALAWQAFGADTYGHHVVNVAFHALASLLLVPLFVRSGVRREAAVAGAALFLLHPVNVEAVAWVSQLKSSSATVLALAALLAQPARPWLGTTFFALSLLAKPSALFALPTAMMWAWVSPATRRRDWAWLGAWVAVFLAFALVEVPTFAKTSGTAPVLYEDVGVRVRTSFAIGLRYLVMVATGRGLSTFHEPPPAESWTDPWWVSAAIVFSLLGWRIVVTLRRRSVEVAYWAWAAASFVAVGGLVLPLPFPMADRYLYFILPGLIGGGLLVGSEAWERARAWLAARGSDPGRLRSVASRAGLALAVAALSTFAVLAHGRAEVWQSGFRMMADAEKNYPDGVAAKTRQATRAARAGDVDAAIAALQAAHRRGYNQLNILVTEPAYAVLRGDPRFQEMLLSIADEHLERLQRNPTPSQLELHVIALAHSVRGDIPASVQVLERALETPGPITEKIRRDLDAMRAVLRRQEAARQGARGSEP